MTGIIIYSSLIGVYGFIIGKSFKGLNPFLMLLGLMFTLPVVGAVEQHQQPLLYIPFAIGFITNFASPLRSVFDFFSGIKMDIERSHANRQYKKEQKQRQKEFDKQQAKYEKERAKQQSKYQSEPNYSQQNSSSYADQKKQAQAEQERLRRQAEELRRQREQFKREQAQARNNQSNKSTRSSTSNDDLNPKVFKDACEILGCKDTDDKATLKKAYQRLSAMYHPDKVEKLGGRRKVQALAEMKLINQAWETVQLSFKS